MFSVKKIQLILNKQLFGIRVKYLLSVLLFFIPFSKKAINRNNLYTEITYYNIFGLETFKIEKSESLIVYKLFDKLIYSKELDNFNENELFEELRKEYYYGVE